MTGWKDIDGGLVMAGSPGHLECLDITFGVLLGERTGWPGLRNLREVRKICVQHGHKELVERCDLANELITAARHLFVRLSTLPDPIDECREAVKLLNQKDDLPDLGDPHA